MKAREIGFPPGLAGGLAALNWRLQIWWDDQPGAVRKSIWAGIAATLVFIGLLLTFHQTVRAAVQQAELRRATTIHQSDRARRCNTLRGQRLRESCLQQLTTEPLAQARMAAPATAVAQTRR